MTSSVTNVTTSLLRSHSHGATTGMLGPVLLLLLLALLVESELLRAVAPSRLGRRGEILYVAIGPLAFAFSLIVVIRFVDLVRFGSIP